MASITTKTKLLYQQRRDGQIQPSGTVTLGGSTVVNNPEVADSADLSTVVLKTGDTMTGNLVLDGAEIEVNTIAEQSIDAGVTIDGVLLKNSDLQAVEVRTNLVNERISGAGVTIDAVLLKDSDVYADVVDADTVTVEEVETDTITEKTGGAGVTIEGVEIKDNNVTGATLEATSQVVTNRIAESTTGAGVIIDNGTTIKDSKVSTDQLESDSESFISGFTGNGYKVAYNNCKYVAEFDQLIIRGMLRAYELEINRIRATNGSLWVTDAVKATSNILEDGSARYFTVEENQQVFRAYDIIRAQAWTGNGVYSINWYVSSVTSTRVYVTGRYGSQVPSEDEGCEGMDFVRIGNTSDTGRQGALYLTASDSNAPYLEVLDGVNDETIVQGDRKVRLGQLNGLTFNGADIGGFGLWSEDAYLTGVINAIAGQIASWDIEGDQIKASNTAGKFALDSSDSSLTVKDTSDIVKIRVGPDSIPGLASLVSSSLKSYTSSLAQSYTDVTHSFTDTGILDTTWWVHKLSTTSSYLDLDANQQLESYNIDGLTIGLPYSTVLKWDTEVSFQVPTDDNDKAGGYTAAYTLMGSYAQTITVNAYSSGGALQATQVTTVSARTTDLNAITIFDKTLVPTTESMYYTIQVRTVNTLATWVERKLTEFSDPEWFWTGETESYSQSLASTFAMQIYSLVMTGTYNQVQLGSNGISHYKNSSKYFMLNEDESDYIQSQGTWNHAAGAVVMGSLTDTSKLGKLTINDAYVAAIYSPYTAAPLSVNTNRNGFALSLFNDGNSSNHYGLRIQAGEDTPDYSDNNYIWAFDGNGTSVGTVLNDTEGGFRIYSVSDEKLKEDIADLKDETDVKAVLRGFKPRKFRYKKHSKEAVRATGYVAQEVKAAIPHGAKQVTDPDSGEEVLMVADTALIPYLHQMVVDQQDEIETLQATVKDLITRIGKLENNNNNKNL